MPEDYRRLLFEDMEVLGAIMEQSRKLKSPIPSGKMKNLTIGGDKDPFIRFLVETEEGDKAFKFDGTTLAAALIRFCIDKKIPMPQKAVKQFSAKDHRMIMDIKI